MNPDLEAVIAEGRRRMRQFEEKTADQLDNFDREVDNHHHLLGHKYSEVREDLKPVSAPLWGVVLETSSGQRIYKEHVPFDIVRKCPRHCACTRHLNQAPDYEVPRDATIDSLISVESKTLMEGRKWNPNRYLQDESYVSNPPYGVIMKKPTPRPKLIQEDFDAEQSSISREQPNTKLVSQYWRRKWKIPKDW